jgi:amidophosphoribosyltransferase
MLHLGLFALQHRGQEACGMVVSDGDELLLEKDLGLVSEVFDEARLSQLELPGAHIGIGHVRYSTTGSNLRFNAQPLTVRSSKGILAIAHNGNFTNALSLRNRLLDEGAVFQTTGDTEVMINLIARYSKMSLVDATAQAMRELEGGFAVVLMNREILLGLRDAHGVRPLSIGIFPGGGYVLASEPVVFPLLGASFLRDVLPGELVYIEGDELRSLQVLEPAPTPCAFEWIYFARDDSILDGVAVHPARIKMGQILAEEALVAADLVVPVPDSGIGAAIGYARRSGIPFEFGLYKNPYAGRTFIQPSQELRDQKVRLKLSPTPALKGRRVVLVDDSIVRGTTSRQIIKMARQAGAARVSFASAAPPVRYPDLYGIDLPCSEELLAHGRNEQEITEALGADAVYYQDLEDLRRVILSSNPQLGPLEDSCFSGHYVTGVPDPDYLARLAMARGDGARQSEVPRAVDQVRDLCV